jgi:glutamine synthetase
LLVTHQGYALDDKTLFRECERVLKTKTSALLQTLGVPNKGIVLSLGLEQEFFVIPKDAYMKRLDIRQLGRALVGSPPPKNQQFSDHYYGKLPAKIEEVLCEVEQELLQIGIPFKTKHNEVANNQFEFCAIYEEAGKSIDHNMITMDILR